jgi:hypothetical protein
MIPAGIDEMKIQQREFCFAPQTEQFTVEYRKTLVSFTVEFF